MSDLEYINSLITKHLSQINGNNINSIRWQIKHSTLDGRGLIANENIFVNDLIFVDYPLLAGPRLCEEDFKGCVVCYSARYPTRVCQNGCGLLVCSEECANSLEHNAECKVINSWIRKVSSENIDSKKFVKNFVPLRALVLDPMKKDFLLQLAYHSTRGSEVKFMKEIFELPESDEKLILRTCYVFDTNAYEMIITKGDENVNLRGLFPIAALMNHSCNPNVRCDFDSHGRMYVRAIKYINAGDEICTTYTRLLWGTPARRHHLQLTKKFSCFCSRCSDRTEFGTYLGALRCTDKKCRGVILQTNPLDAFSNWRCEECNLVVNRQQIAILQNALANFMSSVKLENLHDTFQFLTTKVDSILPATNHIVMEMKSKLVLNLGETEGFRWNQLSTEWLNRGEALCRELLQLYTLLELPHATQPARIRLVLHRCLLQKLKNAHANSETAHLDGKSILDLEKEVVATFNESFEVLKYDIFAPKDLMLKHVLANSNLRQLIELYHNEL